MRVISRSFSMVVLLVLPGGLVSCGTGVQGGSSPVIGGGGGAIAPPLSIAAQAYSAYNSAFLVQANGQAYYSTTLTSVGAKAALMYTAANDIEVAEDAYQYNHGAADRSLIVTLLDTFLVKNGTDWTYDGWNDDIGWMANIFIRGYQFTGQANYLTEAENEWNMAYNRGWDSTLGGGIYEQQGKPGKEALSNNPFIFEGVQLYQLSGDATYLTKAEAIYSWVRTNLVNTTSANNALGFPGQVNQGINGDGTLSSGDNVYNEGTWVVAATDLYRVTGVQQYHDDALLTITRRINKDTTLHSTSECCGNQWAYWITQGISDFATDTNQWGTYLAYLQNNANQAWSERCSLNLTWNDWTNTTNCSLPSDPMEMGSAVGIWLNLPPVALNLSGTFEIQSVASGLAMAVAGGSNVSGANVVQEPFVSGAKESLWMLVPASGGYYQIENVNSSLVARVRGDVSMNAAKGALIEQGAVQGMIPGNDQWMPVKNLDGSYSFYNLNSYQALDVPGGSKLNQVQLDQWFGNSGANQEFNLIPTS
jgi:hypothetical protein